MTTARRYDVIVVGVGTIGSAAAYHLARRGARVLGLERFGIVHDRGSMHGLTRIFRLAYHEDPRYVVLLRRAYALWRDLERASGERLLHVTGLLDIGAEDSWLISGALRSCRDHDLDHELLSATELERRFPAWHPPADAVALLQPDGGYLAAEQSVRAHADAAVAAGAELRTGERVLEWAGGTDGVVVRTDRATYEAGRVVLCPGAWAPGVLRLPEQLLTVERQVVAWFDTRGTADFRPDRFPVFIVEEDGAVPYGFPDDGRGLKVGRMHYPGQLGDAEDLDREAHAEEIDVLRDFLARWLPAAAAGATLEASACLFTNTPDLRFVVDHHPDEPNAVIASVCSGHVFKFAPVAGEILADLALDGTTRHPIDFLRLDRLGAPRGARA